jgi:hypothetical protein
LKLTNDESKNVLNLSVSCIKNWPDDEKQKVKLKYPCPWVDKIIGPDADEM